MVYRIDTKTYDKSYGVIQNVSCPHCRQSTSYVKIKTITRASFFFIPVIWTINRIFVACSVCKCAYIVKPKTFKHINNNIDVLNAIYEQQQCDIEKKQKLRDKYSVGVSDKKQKEAILSCIGISVGLPFFFIGRPILGILSFVSFYALLIFDKMEFLNIISMIGIILAILIARGKVKDGKGKYILSEEQKKLFLGDEHE